MSDDMLRPDPDFEQRLQAAARRFRYPPSPQLAKTVVNRMRPLSSLGSASRSRRGWLVAGAILALILAAILAVPPVRAAVLDWIRIGAVRIFLVQPAPTAAPTLAPGGGSGPTPPAATLAPTPTPLPSILDISGETTLAGATTLARFSPLLPTVPADLGQPDRVFEQDLGGPMVVLVWMDKNQPRSVRLSLSETAYSNVIFQKIQPQSVTDTRVNGQPALWMDAPYLLMTGSGNTEVRRLIESGHTLVWTRGKMTFRLETALDLPSAVRIAESLR